MKPKQVFVMHRRIHVFMCACIYTVSFMSTNVSPSEATTFEEKTNKTTGSEGSG